VSLPVSLSLSACLSICFSVYHLLLTLFCIHVYLHLMMSPFVIWHEVVEHARLDVLQVRWIERHGVYSSNNSDVGGVVYSSNNSDVGGVGCGVNVTNKDPTVCINDLVHRLNDLDSRSVPEPFTVEEVIARSVSVLEELIDKFETEDRQLILDQYYSHWLHRQVYHFTVSHLLISYVSNTVTGLAYIVSICCHFCSN